MSETEKKVYAPSKVVAYFPPTEAGAKGKWVEMKDGEQLQKSFASLDLIRYECEKYVRVLKVRDNKQAIYDKYANLIGVKNYTIDFATSLVLKDFAANATKWIPKSANKFPFSQGAISSWGVME